MFDSEAEGVVDQSDRCATWQKQNPPLFAGEPVSVYMVMVSTGNSGV